MVRKAGCVPVRRNAQSNEWEVMLVQSRWTPEIWLFPKGTVELSETQKQAAVRETREEAGVVGDLGPKLGVWHVKRGTKVKQKMWVLFVTTQYNSDNKQWKERKKRARGWHSFEEAKQIITALPTSLQRPELMEMLLKTQSALADIDSGVTVSPSSESDDDEDTLNDSSNTDDQQQQACAVQVLPKLASR